MKGVFSRMGYAFALAAMASPVFARTLDGNFAHVAQDMILSSMTPIILIGIIFGILVGWFSSHDSTETKRFFRAIRWVWLAGSVLFVGFIAFMWMIVGSVELLDVIASFAILFLLVSAPFLLGFAISYASWRLGHHPTKPAR